MAKAVDYIELGVIQVVQQPNSYLGKAQSLPSGTHPARMRAKTDCFPLHMPVWDCVSNMVTNCREEDYMHHASCPDLNFTSLGGVEGSGAA